METERDERGPREGYNESRTVQGEARAERSKARRGQGKGPKTITRPLRRCAAAPLYRCAAAPLRRCAARRRLKGRSKAAPTIYGRPPAVYGETIRPTIYGADHTPTMVGHQPGTGRPYGPVKGRSNHVWSSASRVRGDRPECGPLPFVAQPPATAHYISIGARILTLASLGHQGGSLDAALRGVSFIAPVY